MEREARAKRKADEEKASLKPGFDDLFDTESATGTPRAGTPANGGSRAGTPKPGEKKKDKELRKGIPTFRKPQMEDDLIAAMDFGVEIEI
jgi:RNA polymerase-associated protein RTF1